MGYYDLLASIFDLEQLRTQSKFEQFFACEISFFRTCLDSGIVCAKKNDGILQVPLRGLVFESAHNIFEFSVI